MPSPILNAKIAAERLLKNVSPSLPTAYEAVAFTPPATMYQSCQFMISKPDDPVFNTGYYREVIQFQVFVLGPTGKGTAEVYNRAELIRAAFHKGKTMQEAGTNIYVLTTPQIGGTLVTNDRVICPVMINLTVEVST